jgi:CheY-like chemotaxis protein
MNNGSSKASNPIMIVENSEAERKLFYLALEDLNIKNEIYFFENGRDALNYLRGANAVPFIIFSNINMPLMDGVELKKAINDDHSLRVMSIPFIFISSTLSTYEILKAHDTLPQGYFTKAQDFTTLKANLAMILDYWSQANLPMVNAEK